MCALADGGAGDLDDVVPSAVDQRLAEGPGTVGVGAFAHHQHRGVLAQRHSLVQRCRGGFRGWPPWGHAPAGEPLDDLAQVFGRGPAAAADQHGAVVTGEGVQRVRELGRGQRVGGAVAAEHRQTGVRHDREPGPGVLGQVTQVFAHLGRPGRAVQTDQVDAERLKRRERGGDL